MKCTYQYKGKTFETESLLDDYLVSTESLKPFLGDIVYSLSRKQSRYLNQLKETTK